MNVAELEAIRDLDRSGTGNCFSVAIHLLGRNPHAFLVHGIATGNGGEMLGKQGWHAWVELDDPTGAGRETICIDRANGNNACMPRSVYYLLLQIEHASRYTYDEAKALWAERQSDGPWLPVTATAHPAQLGHATA